MPKKRVTIPVWLHGPITAAIRSALAVPVIAGFDAAVHVARAAARTYCGMSFNKPRLDRAISHLRQAFPTWDDDQRRAVTVESYEHLFTLAVEMTYTPRYMTEDGWGHRLEIGGVEPVVSVLLSDRPCIMITGHCGNWELMGYTLALLGFRLHALYRPLDLKPLDVWVRRTREACGLKLVDKFGAVDQLPRILSEGHPVGFVADQNAGDRGLFVPFFGRLASTYKSIGLLALQYNATVMCGSSIRLPGRGFRYRLDMADIMHPADWADAPDPLYYITARYRRAIERTVISAPNQYLWMHRIWKSRPRHERMKLEFPGSLRAKLESLPWMSAADVEGIVEQSRRDSLAAPAPR